MLFAVTAVAESVDIEECVYLPVLFRMLSSLPLYLGKLVTCALNLIGKFMPKNLFSI